MSWLVWNEPKALIMENKDTKRNNTFRNCGKFSPGARGVFHMEAPGSVQEPGDDFFYWWFSPGARGWICYWRSRISPGVSSCWSSCTRPPLIIPCFTNCAPYRESPQPFSTLAGSGGGGRQTCFLHEKGLWECHGYLLPGRGGNPRFWNPHYDFGFFEKKIYTLAWVNGGKCGFLLQKGLGGCQGYLLPRGGGNPRFWKPY